MRSYFGGITLAGMFLLVGCALPPPSATVVSHDPLMDREGGVALLVDVCVQRDGIGGSGDYFVSEPSMLGARVSADYLRQFVTDSGIKVVDEFLLACGAQHEQQPIDAAVRVGEKVVRQAQPLDSNVDPASASDTVRSLGIVSSYTLERIADDSDAEKFKVSPQDFAASARAIRSVSTADSILYLGVLGTGRSKFKDSLAFTGQVLVGTVTGLSTGGLIGDYSLIFVPGRKVSGRVMGGALVDINSGDVVWSKVITNNGNPLKEETWDQPEVMDYVFHDVVFQQ